jgi:hypothetical protein
VVHAVNARTRPVTLREISFFFDGCSGVLALPATEISLPLKLADGEPVTFRFDIDSLAGESLDGVRVRDTI